MPPGAWFSGVLVLHRSVLVDRVSCRSDLLVDITMSSTGGLGGRGGCSSTRPAH